MDKSKIKLLREVIEAAVKNHPSFKGVSITLGNARFSSESVSFSKVTVTEPDADGNSQDKTVIDFKRHAFRFGLDGFLGKAVVIGGNHFTIYGLNTRRSKRPVVLKSAAGHYAAASVDCVKNALGIRAQYSL